MKINLKNLIGVTVFENGREEPCARVIGVGLLENQKYVGSIHLETLSLIPLKRTISVDDVLKITREKIILKPGSDVLKLKKNEENGNCAEVISKVLYYNGKCGKIKNMQFDFETGEIFSFEIGKGFFRKKDFVPADRMQVKDNTIYVE